MSTTVYVARSLGVDTGSLEAGSTLGTIVGGDDALDTNDGDTSYVLIARDGGLTGGTEHTSMTFRWERVSGSAPVPASVTGITVEGALRRDDTATPETAFTANFSAPGVEGLGFNWLQGSGVDDAYYPRSSSVDPYFTERFDDDTPWLITTQVPDLFFRTATRLTYLRATVESARRSVVRHGVRNDGLISTAPRRWGQQSSYQSGRGGGYA